MKPSSGRHPESAFTRLDVFAALVALALVALVPLPALASGRPRSNRVQCANNLRQIAAAFQMWGDARLDREPWEVPLAEGGTYRHTLAANVWFQFAWISNELATPKILLCPSDTGEGNGSASKQLTNGACDTGF